MDSVEDKTCDIEMMRRPPKKMHPGPPHIMVCVPVGTKDIPSEYRMPSPGQARGGCADPDCPCKNHGMMIGTKTKSSLMVPMHWALNVANLVVPLNTTIGYLVEGDMLSADARNKMTKRTIEVGSKYIFYWDDDTILPPLAIYTMHNILENNPDIGLVTGVYCTREDPPEPLLYKSMGDGAWYGFSIDPESPPEDIHGAGGGCILARVEDVAKMEEPYWYDEQVVNPEGVGQTVWGHDIRFIKNFREQSGKRTVVKGSILCGHWDAEKKRMYELPKNTLPHKRHTPEKAIHELVQFRDFDVDILDRALMETGGEQRLFLVAKNGKDSGELVPVFETRFERVKMESVDQFWLAICEGKRDGKSDATDSADQGGDRDLCRVSGGDTEPGDDEQAV